MGKDTRAGRNSSHHIQLALFPRYIACMDAVAIICFRGLFRFLYRIACFLVALAIILCILIFLVF